PYPTAFPTRRSSDLVERSVVAGAVAVVGLDDVEEGLVAGPDQPIREHVRMRAAALARHGVDGLDVVRAHVVQLLVRDRHDLVLADRKSTRLNSSHQI